MESGLVGYGEAAGECEAEAQAQRAELEMGNGAQPPSGQNGGPAACL